jgi:hypothetical protein
MHYDYKTKLNRLDSQKYVNMRVPAIDWKLNEAQDIFIQMIASPRYARSYGFESNQRTIDDLRTIVVNGFELPAIPTSRNRFIVHLPVGVPTNEYLHHISSYAHCVKGDCSMLIRTSLIQHDDKAEESPFDKSSFEWEQVNMKIVNNDLILHTDGTFTITKVYLDFIRKPKFFHSAEDASPTGYILPDGETILTGYQNCELPEILYKEIVDLAVLITTGDLLPDYQAKQSKLQLIN